MILCTSIIVKRGSAANKGQSTVKYRQSSAFDTHIYHVMIILTGGFSKKSLLFITIIIIS